jgi:hypothetical protein
MKQLSFFWNDPREPQPLERHQLHWCRTVLSRYLEVTPEAYINRRPGCFIATIKVNHAAALKHPRLNDMLFHAAAQWRPHHEGGEVHRLEDGSFYVVTYAD